MKKQSGLRRALPIAALFGSLLALAGCAVMTVDVDVYKGPLANEPEVQLHEAAVMAVGAKPLLKEFRDLLEGIAIVSQRESAKNNQEQSKSAKVDSTKSQTATLATSPPEDPLTTYRSRASQAPNEISGYTFRSSVAARANEVVSLYSARYPDPVVADLVQRGLDAAARYEAAYNVLRPSPLPPERALLARALHVAERLPDPVRTDRRAQVTSYVDSRPPVQVARSAYLELVDPRRTPTGWIFYDEYLWAAYSKLQSRPPRAEASSANDRFRYLANASNARRDVTEFFPELAAPALELTRGQLIQTVTNAAQAFLAARAALEDLFDVSLSLTERVNSPTYASSIDAEQVTKDLAELLDKLISSLELQTRMGSASLNPSVEQPATSQFLAHFGQWRQSQTTTDAQDSRAMLQDMLASDPRDTAAALRDIHLSAKIARPDDFGIVAGPVLSDEAVSPSAIKAKLQSLSTTLSGSLARGRSDKGIDDLVEDFINAHTRNGRAFDPAQPPLADHIRDDLLDALVQFAEKVLIIADHSILLAMQQDSSLAERTTTDSYLLQAVGNSILVQVNEIRARLNHDRRQQQAFQRIKDNAVFKGEEAVESSTAVMDRIIYDFEQRLRDEIAKHGPTSAAANNLKSAIALAYEQRARLVYIRTPSFYLKNSYPVSSLVRNDGQGVWRNSLADHGARSIPLAGNLIAAGSRPDTDAVQLQQEIDRRFWQSINRIRVAGAGKTNYALVKDAVGNWYVKNFSADTEPITKAAVAAAIVAAGGMPAIPGASSLPTPIRADGAADQHAARLIETYNERTEADAAEIKQFIESLSGSVNEAITSLPCAAQLGGLAKQITDQFDAFFPKSLLASLSLGGADLEDAIVTALRSARRFHLAARHEVQNAKMEPAPEDVVQCRRSALQVLEARIAAPLQRLVARRAITVESHCASLHAAHDSISSAARTPAVLTAATTTTPDP